MTTPATGANGSDGGATIIDGITATGGRGGAKGAAFNVLPTGGPTAIQNANNTIPGGAELIAQHLGYGGSSGFLFSDKNAIGGKGADSEFGVGGVAVGISSGVNASTGKNATGNGSGGSGAVSIYGSGSTGVSMSGGAGADGLAIFVGIRLMNRYALIKNNIVVNIVVWDGAGDMFADFKAVNISGVAVDIGWIYDGNNFTAPNLRKLKNS